MSSLEKTKLPGFWRLKGEDAGGVEGLEGGEGARQPGGLWGGRSVCTLGTWSDKLGQRVAEVPGPWKTDIPAVAKIHWGLSWLPA